MSATLIRGLVLSLFLTMTANLMAQPGPREDEHKPVKPTGPAAKKAEELVRAYTARIEKEIEQDRKAIDRLRAELHELIDVRFAMSETIAELRGELASKGTYSADFVAPSQAAPMATEPAESVPMQIRRDFVYGLGSALPKDPTQEQREQLRRLAPRSDLKRLINGLGKEVDETRREVDQLAYRLLELQAGIPSSFQGMRGGMGGMRAGMGGMGGGMGGMGGGMGGMGGGMMGGMGGGPNRSWFGSMGMGSAGMGMM